MRRLCDEGAQFSFLLMCWRWQKNSVIKSPSSKAEKLITAGTMEEVKGNTSLENVFLELEA